MSSASCPLQDDLGPKANKLDFPATLRAIWEHAWKGLVERVGAHFPRAETRQHVADYLKGLLSPIERKNSWQLAEAVGEETPYALQHLLGRASWDADAVRDDLRSYVIEHLGDPQGVLAIDETGFLKKGTHSVGAQRQYSGTAGRIENCQIGVFLSYATARGRTFLDRALYLPTSWTDDRPRCEQAGVPADVTFATKPQLALKMVERALDAGVPAAWVVGDEVYGDDSKLRRGLEQRRQPYVLTVSSQHRIWKDLQQIKVSDLCTQLPADAWQRLSAGDGTKGPRWYDWAYTRWISAEAPDWQRGILFRRSLTDTTEVAYYAVFAPHDCSLQAIVLAAGTRWSIEECFESAKGEVGLDQYEVRSWTGWYRHITLALWAHAFLTVQRAASDEPMGKKIRRTAARCAAAAGGSGGGSGAGPELRRTAVGRAADPVDRPRGAPAALVAAVERST
jgi:SRSO17 transposase